MTLQLLDQCKQLGKMKCLGVRFRAELRGISPFKKHLCETLTGKVNWGTITQIICFDSGLLVQVQA